MQQAADTYRDFTIKDALTCWKGEYLCMDRHIISAVTILEQETCVAKRHILKPARCRPPDMPVATDICMLFKCMQIQSLNAAPIQCDAVKPPDIGDENLSAGQFGVVVQHRESCLTRKCRRGKPRGSTCIGPHGKLQRPLTDQDPRCWQTSRMK